jgi:hypothetical protein
MPTKEDPDVLYSDWATQQRAYHNTRVLCDLSGLTLEEKNLICACIMVESEFYNYLPDGQPTKHENLNADGSLSSTDWGLCQINDWFHVAPHGAPFASVEFVLANPRACVQWMITCYKQGLLGQWDSYLHGSYRQYLIPTSAMFKLATPLP